MADQPTPPKKGEQMTDDEMTDATTSPILRIYTVLETDRGGVWAFEPFAMTHCVFVEESNYYIERSRASALQAERDAALARVAQLAAALFRTSMNEYGRKVVDHMAAYLGKEVKDDEVLDQVLKDALNHGTGWTRMLPDGSLQLIDPSCISITPPPDLGKEATLVQEPARWQPIETAPKDGSEILLTDGAFVHCGRWCPTVDDLHPWRFLDWTSKDERKGLNGWRADKSGPSHWMPMPPPDLGKEVK